MIAHKGLLPAITMLTVDDNNIVRSHAQDVLCALAGELNYDAFVRITLAYNTQNLNKFDPPTADVAIAKDMKVITVLQCVSWINSRRKRLTPRCYSPTSVMQFDFDFDANC